MDAVSIAHTLGDGPLFRAVARACGEVDYGFGMPGELDWRLVEFADLPGLR